MRYLGPHATPDNPFCPTLGSRAPTPLTGSRRCRPPSGTMRSRHSSLTDRTNPICGTTTTPPLVFALREPGQKALPVIPASAGGNTQFARAMAAWVAETDASTSVKDLRGERVRAGGRNGPYVCEGVTTQNEKLYVDG